MRNKAVTIASKTVDVQERRIGELKQLVADLFPGSGGNLANIDISKILETNVNDLLYKKLPEVFPGLTEEDIDNAYPSEIESLVEAFIDVHFLGLKGLIKPLMGLAQAGAMQQAANVMNVPMTPTSRQGGTTRKR